MQNANPARKNQKLLKSKADFSREQLADLLENLATRIREGEMTIGTGDAALGMKLPGTIRTTMEVTDSRKRRGIERELELELSWYVDDAGAPVDTASPVSGFAVS
ncbi:amphi-Trp domain-containing protein [Corynebacterium riegelii]|uniref:amphi-Trp domain-containing protein n=1 Tax=Corynebacterium riegelii TaxID=156976 RepID=UPI00191D55B3|nr:amphi-Trp domain-containing protein [Corynebacterium riegelii]QQU83236.1 amphi-Trp domain-containing protein [Corynebacterium riegelii]